MGKIATVADVIAISGSSAGSYNTKRCATLTIAQNLGCKLKSGYSYSNSKLVPKDSLENDPYTFDFTVTGTMITNAAQNGYLIYLSSSSTVSANSSSPVWLITNNTIKLSVVNNILRLSIGTLSPAIRQTVYACASAKVTSSATVGMKATGSFTVPNSTQNVTIKSIK